MTEKAKRIVIISICCLLCAATVIGIATRFSGNSDIPSGVVSGDQSESGEPTVNIDGDQIGTIPGNQTDVDIQVQVSDQSDPAQGADSKGTEQTIQADPVKPDVREKPNTPDNATPLPDDHKAEDVPEADRKTEDEAPPTNEEPPKSAQPANNEPAAGSTNSAGQVYVPGFGYIESEGAGTVIKDEDIYENGNKVGIMD